ncbi:hypothetical protein PYCCODRAFT_1073040 [Trametes coccinea BRFM310]|uniref:Uncharacterized protein n=1 Tax=Trametes coccinea (strain BRFM310) TaxID=1353009 RepID=A0A1Y2IZP1_TRAC3|nr:hypothetical protein PYCCODRAFT_1073040 [Trametes coccinea BRFM310]
MFLYFDSREGHSSLPYTPLIYPALPPSVCLYFSVACALMVVLRSFMSGIYSASLSGTFAASSSHPLGTVAVGREELDHGKLDVGMYVQKVALTRARNPNDKSGEVTNRVGGDTEKGKQTRERGGRGNTKSSIP